MGRAESLRILGIGLLALLVGSISNAIAAHGSALCAVASAVMRQTSWGHRIEGVLYVPLHADGARYPVFVLWHGCLRDYGRHVQNALALACGGTVMPNRPRMCCAVCFAPAVPSPLKGPVYPSP